MLYTTLWNSNLIFCTTLPQKIVSLDKALVTLELDPKEPQLKAPFLFKTRIGIKTRAAATDPLAPRSCLKLATFFSSQLSVSQEVLAQTPCRGHQGEGWRRITVSCGNKHVAVQSCAGALPWKVLAGLKSKTKEEESLFNYHRQNISVLQVTTFLGVQTFVLQSMTNLLTTCHFFEWMTTNSLGWKGIKAVDRLMEKKLGHLSCCTPDKQI